MMYCRISKISNSVGRNDNFQAKARKLSILPTSLDVFDIRQHYIRILNITYIKHAVNPHDFHNYWKRRNMFEPVLEKAGLMHLRKESTHVSLRSPHRLTWTLHVPFRCLKHFVFQGATLSRNVVGFLIEF